MRWLVVLCVVAVSGCFGSTPTTEPEPLPPGEMDGELSSSGRWLAPFDGEVPAVNMVLLHDGRVLYWSGVEAEDDGDPTSQVFFTASPYWGESRILERTPSGFNVTKPGDSLGDAGDLFCAGQTILPDGRVLTVGGTEWHEFTDPSGPFLDGTTDARIFDPATNNWTRVSDMVLGRWYPSLLTLHDGTPVAASGIESLTQPGDHWPNWEAYDVDADRWDLVQGTLDHLLPLYPRLHPVPGGPMAGEVFYSTAGTLWGPFGEHPQQPEWSSMQSYDVAEDTWHTHDRSVFGSRNYASSVLLAAGPEDGYRSRVLSSGGTLQQSIVALDVVEIIELGDQPVARQGPAMHHARWNHQSVLLPDGQVLTIGGGLYDNVVLHGQENVPVLEAELFNPVKDEWKEVAAMTVPRMYHSSAVLLPDGRVLTGGHVPLPNPSEAIRDTVNPQVVETRLEIYEPGYLFRGPRPVIDEAPSSLRYGQTFDVQFRSPSPVASVMLMHPGATTHAFDSGQRAIWLEVVAQTQDTLTLRAPPSGVVSPPGYHMLFVNADHQQGAIPSEAAWIHLS